MSNVYKIERTQHLPVSIERAWDFFSSPANLQQITPPTMDFTVISSGSTNGKMYPGQIIEYYVTPIPGIKKYWMTEITYVEEGKYFIDEQRIGPYSLWHHQHHFKETDHGVLMTDIIHYKIPFWFFGDIANALFVKQQLKKIFDFRFKKVEEIFGGGMS